MPLSHDLTMTETERTTEYFLLNVFICGVWKLRVHKNTTKQIASQHYTYMIEICSEKTTVHTIRLFIFCACAFCGSNLCVCVCV